jgi:hypothetical protein
VLDRAGVGAGIGQALWAPGPVAGGRAAGWGAPSGSPWQGAFAGDPDRQRQGSFGDVDRDVIVTFARGAEHLRVATHRSLRRLLRPVALDGERADRLVDEPHGGHGLVLAEVAPRARRDALTDLENPTRAA